MKFHGALVSACLASLVGATPTPLTDIGSTSVKVSSVEDNPNQFVVDVTRTDVLVEDGETFAERIMSVDLVFDISEDNVLVNGQQVSTLGEGPKASIVKATFVRSDVEDPEKMSTLFSDGLINVEVSSEVEPIGAGSELDSSGEPVVGRRITIHERILEVDGSKVRESMISSHVIDVYSNGTVYRLTSDPALDSQATIDVSGSETTPCDGSQLLGQLGDISNWSEDNINTAALYGFSVAFSLAFVYFIIALVRRRRQNSVYAPVSSGDCPPGYDSKDAAFSDLKGTSLEVTEVTDDDEPVTVLESLTSNRD